MYRHSNGWLEFRENEEFRKSPSECNKSQRRDIGLEDWKIQAWRKTIILITHLSSCFPMLRILIRKKQKGYLQVKVLNFPSWKNKKSETTVSPLTGLHSLSSVSSNTELFRHLLSGFLLFFWNYARLVDNWIWLNWRTWYFQWGTRTGKNCKRLRLLTA